MALLPELVGFTNASTSLSGFFRPAILGLLGTSVVLFEEDVSPNDKSSFGTIEDIAAPRNSNSGGFFSWGGSLAMMPSFFAFLPLLP